MKAPEPIQEIRPWGEELWLTRGYDAPSMVKIISVNPNEVLSLQYHKDREEFWLVISGEQTVYQPVLGPLVSRSSVL